MLSMIRSNSYIAIKHCNDRIMKDKKYDGKKFTMEFIEALMRRSYALNYSTVTIPRDSVLLCKDSNVACRRRRNIGHSKNLCTFFEKQVRFEKPDSLHQFKNSASYKLRKRCIWCRYLEQEAKKRVQMFTQLKVGLGECVNIAMYTFVLKLILMLIILHLVKVENTVT